MYSDEYDETSSGYSEEEVGEWSSCYSKEDEEYWLPRVRAEAVAMGDGFTAPQNQHHLLRAAHSPTSPTYSLCASRLRWRTHNAEQLLLGLPHSPSTVNALSVQTTRELCHSGASRRQLCHRDRDTHQPNQISFISVAHFPFDSERRVLKRAPQDESRIFATDLPTESSLPSSLVSKAQELSSYFSSSKATTSVCCESDCSCLSNERFISFLAMPVPESFCSMWSTDHVPALHISATPDKLKKLQEIRRDDNHNIEEVTEREVPSSRLHSGLRNGNGYHDNNNHHAQIHHDEADQYPERIQPLQSREPKNAEYSESVSISRIPAHQEYRYGVRYDIENPRRFREEVRMVPGQPDPGRYYSTYTQCFIGSPYRRYKETVFIQLNAPNTRQYTTTVFVFPKSVRETFVSEVDHHEEKTIKLYKVGVNMEARDYVSVKFMQVN